MHDESALVAIEAALRSPDYCACGKRLDLTARDGCLWLECRAFAQPSRLPARVTLVLREFVHERRFVVEEVDGAAPAAAAARRAVSSSRSAVARA